jgi:hypothetical protein
MVALMRVSSSSSPRMANCKWRGVILRRDAPGQPSTPSGIGMHPISVNACKLSQVQASLLTASREDRAMRCRQAPAPQHTSTRRWLPCRRQMWRRRGRGERRGSSSACGYGPLGTGGVRASNASTFIVPHCQCTPVQQGRLSTPAGNTVWMKRTSAATSAGFFHLKTGAGRSGLRRALLLV